MRYVVRINGALNVNIRLVAIGAAAPYFTTWTTASKRDAERERGMGRARRHRTLPRLVESYGTD